MTTKSTSGIFWSNVNLFYGTAGSTTTTACGHIEKEGATLVTHSKEQGDYYVSGVNGPVKTRVFKRGLIVSSKLAQFVPDLLGLALGIAPVSNTVPLGGAAIVDLQFSFRISGTLPDGSTTLWLDLPYAVAGDAPELPLGEVGVTEIPFAVKMIDDAPSTAKWDFVGTNRVATLSTGALTRIISQGYHAVAGEGGAADDLDSITAADLVDGETLRLQVADEDDPITLVHLNDTLELHGDADFILAKYNDYIDLKYNEAGSKWAEIGRHDVTV